MDIDLEKEIHDTPQPKPKPSIRPLSPKQERRLVAYLDNEFLELTRGYKKRTSPTSHLTTLSAYLSSARKILALTLQVPPVDPSTSLRTSFLLRLTNDVLSSIRGYPPNAENVRLALDWLDDLDQSWVAVLQAQVWDPNEGVGEDLVVDAEDVARGVKSTPMSQTERARLRGLLLGGVSTLEEWIEGNAKSIVGAGMDVQDALNDVFSWTMEELGGLGVVQMPTEESCSMDCDDMDGISMEQD